MFKRRKKSHIFQQALVVVVLLVVILSASWAIYWMVSGMVLPRDLTELPLDVKLLEYRIAQDPGLATSVANPLRPIFSVPPAAEVPTSFRIPMLLYHYVENVKDPGDKIRISLNVQPYFFDLQLKTLKEAGYTFMTPSQIPALFTGQLRLPAKPVMLTFDDGYRDFYTDVWPLLKKYQARAVEYVVSGFLDKPNYLTRVQLHEMAASDLVEIGSHTINHAYLKGLSQERVRTEVIGGKQALEKELGRPVVSFAYPYGAFDLKTIEIVKEAGFKTAVTTIAGETVTQRNIFFINRIRPGARTGRALLELLERI